MAFVKFSGNSLFRPDPKSEPKEKKAPTRIKPVSDKRKEETKEYNFLRKEFLIGKICPITKGKATQIHHKKGRLGELYLNTDFWLAVSAEGHKWIEEHPEEAKKLGYSLNRL